MFSVLLAIVGGKPEDGLDAEEDVGRVAGVGMDDGVGEAGDGDLHLGGAALRKHGEIEGATVDPGPARDDDAEPVGPSRGTCQPRLPIPKQSHWVVSAILALVMAPSAIRGAATPRGRALARVARRGYFALCSYVDALIGELLAHVDDETLVIYTLDHGEMLGDRGMWTKMVMHEASAGVGPGVPAGVEVQAPVSLVDLHPTILEAAGLPADDERPGRSLLGAMPADRPVLSEFHDGGAPTGYFMLRRENWNIPISLQNPKILVGYDREVVCDGVAAGFPLFGQSLAEEIEDGVDEMPEVGMEPVVGHFPVQDAP